MGTLWVRKFRKFLHIAHRERYTPTQRVPFCYGVKIKNIGNTVFEGALIKNIRIASADGKTLQRKLDKQYVVNTLNPSEEAHVSFESTDSDFSGLMWISFELTPRGAGIAVRTHQPAYDGQIDLFDIPNAWGDSFFILSQFESTQKHTNYLVALLTFFTFLEAVYGIKKTLILILTFTKYLLEILLRFITSLL
jgi:hypothetical protein